MTDVDGLPTGHGAPPSMPAPPGGHPIGASVIDHVVVATPDLARTIAAIEAGLGLPLLRTRDAGSAGAPMRQAFFRMGEVVLEVVGGAEPDPDGGPARFYGIAITVEDLDAAVERAGDRIGRAEAGRATGALDRHLPQGGRVGRAGGAHEPVAGSRRALIVCRSSTPGRPGAAGWLGRDGLDRPHHPSSSTSSRRASSARPSTQVVRSEHHRQVGPGWSRADGRRDAARPSWSRRRSSAGRPSAAARR